MLVGHNPGMQELLVPWRMEQGLRGVAAAEYPTGALAEISFDVSNGPT